MRAWGAGGRRTTDSIPNPPQLPLGARGDFDHLKLAESRLDWSRKFRYSSELSERAFSAEDLGAIARA